jgi:hypothetical protein
MGRKIAKSIARIVGLSLLLCLLLAMGLRQPVLGKRSAHGHIHCHAATLKAHVAQLTEQYAPRSYLDSDNLAAIVDLLCQGFAEAGAEVRLQPYTAGRGAPGGRQQYNVIARFGPVAGPLVVVGAHYDAFATFPGADDNASGVAGLLELARMLGQLQPSGPVELVAYSTEEPPFFGGQEMGSAVHATALAKSGAKVVAMLCLEMIGYYGPEQPLPSPLLAVLYPRHGNFAAVVGRWQDRKLARFVKQCFRGATALPLYSYSGPTQIGADLSDHRNYWKQGFAAVMITDTAFLRNPNYHTPGDTAATLDYARMAAVVDGVFNTIQQLSRNGGF